MKKVQRGREKTLSRTFTSQIKDVLNNADLAELCLIVQW
jgi:hypothetical protein